MCYCSTMHLNTRLISIKICRIRSYEITRHDRERCLNKGIDKEDLKEIVRGKQAQLLFALCYLLEDPGVLEKEVKGMGWGLFQTDEHGNPTKPIFGLHEGVLATDPTGREMRPKKRV